MTDSTAHNLGLIQDVCAEPETESALTHWFVMCILWCFKEMSNKCGKKFMMHLEQKPSKISKTNDLYGK